MRACVSVDEDVHVTAAARWWSPEVVEPPELEVQANMTA